MIKRVIHKHAHHGGGFDPQHNAKTHDPFSLAHILGLEVSDFPLALLLQMIHSLNVGAFNVGHMLIVLSDQHLLTLFVISDGGFVLLDKLLAAHPGELIADQVIEELRDKLRASPLSMLLDPAMLGVIRIKLAAMIDRRIAEKGPKLLRNKLEGLGSDILNRPLRETAEPFRSRIPELADKLLLLFRHVLENNLESLLRAARIDQIVERRIASFDAAQLEQLIFGIMKRELRAIVYLGAALGFLMGFINLLL